VDRYSISGERANQYSIDWAVKNTKKKILWLIATKGPSTAYSIEKEMPTRITYPVIHRHLKELEERGFLKREVGKGEKTTVVLYNLTLAGLKALVSSNLTRPKRKALKRYDPYELTARAFGPSYSFKKEKEFRESFQDIAENWKHLAPFILGYWKEFKTLGVDRQLLISLALLPAVHPGPDSAILYSWERGIIDVFLDFLFFRSIAASPSLHEWNERQAEALRTIALNQNFKERVLIESKYIETEFKRVQMCLAFLKEGRTPSKKEALTIKRLTRALNSLERKHADIIIRANQQILGS
jgi:DNA-binding HxlR family transcriptional regulator